MHLKPNIILLWVLLITACSTDNSDLSIVSSKPDGRLYAEKVNLEKRLLLPTKIEFINPDRVLIFENTPDSIFNLFSAKDGSLLQSFGKTGKGPEEFLLVKNETLDFKSSALNFLDNNELVVYKEIGKDSLVFSNKYPISSYPEPINGFVALSDSLFIRDNSFINNDHPDDQFVIFSTKNLSIKTFGQYPKTHQNFHSYIEKYQFFKTSSTYNDFIGKLAYFYTYHPLFKIFDKDGNLIRKVDYQIESIEKTSKNQRMLFSVSPVSTSKFIYTIYLGDIKDNIFNPEEDFQPEILIWSWTGDLAFRYKLDHLIGSFTVDEKTKTLYATDLNGGKFIYKYQLPEAKEETQN